MGMVIFFFNFLFFYFSIFLSLKGCLLYELAALKPPFDAANVVSLAVKINNGRFARIPNKYSDTLQDAIKGMLQVRVIRGIIILLLLLTPYTFHNFS
jgi:hypothetical protein